MKLLIQSQVYIALIAVAFSVETELLLYQPLELHPYHFLVFLATFLVYNISRVAIKPMQSPFTVFMVALALAAIVLVGVGFWARWQVLVMLTPLAFLSLLYAFPVVPFNKRFVTLRSIPYIKIFVITIVWSLATVLLPVVRIQQVIDIHVLLIFIERMIFVFVLALMFDICDMETDRLSGLKTIPLLLGKAASQKLCKGLLILFLLITGIHYGQTIPVVLPAMLLSAAGAFFLVDYTGFSSKPVYLAWVDGMMLLQAVLLFFCLHLSGKMV